MATYLQGVTDYIPEIQPFQPDYNILTQALATKEAQYQQGYDNISNIYGTLLNSSMTHEENIERRDRYFTQIQNEIQKIAGLDLSKQDNVTAATELFKPLIQDKYIHKDMAFTRSGEIAMMQSQNYKNCVGDNCDGSWWETGDLEVQYRRQEFANANLDDTLRFGNLSYTPFHNAYKMAMDYAKEMDFESQSVQLSPDGMYMISTTNGQQIVPSLSQYMMAAVGNDPKVAATFQTQAYVDRKNYVAANAQQYGGEEQAERQYFTEIFTAVEQSNRRQQELLEQQNQNLNNKKKIVEENKKAGIDPNYDKDPEALLLGLDQQKQVISANQTQANTVADLSNSAIIPNLPIDQLRIRVDSIIASQSMQSSLITAASDYAMLTQKIDVKADEFAKMRVAHQYKMAEIGYEAQLAAKAEAAANQTLAEAAGVTDGVIVPGDVAQTDPNYNVNEELLKAEEALRGTGVQMTEELANQLVSTLTETIINNPNASPARRQEAQRLIQETFGVLQTSTTYEEKTFADEFAEEMVQDWDPDDKFTWYNALDWLDAGKQIADASWDYVWSDDKKTKVKVEQEGVLVKDESGNLRVKQGWSDLPFLTDENSASHILELQKRTRALVNSEDFAQLIHGQEQFIMPVLLNALNNIQGTEAELAAVQQAHLQNNQAVLAVLKSTPVSDADPFIQESYDQLLTANGEIRSLEEFTEAIRPIIEKYPDREVFSYEKAKEGFIQGMKTFGTIRGIAPVAAIGNAYRAGTAPMSTLSDDDLMEEIESIYDEIKEDFGNLYTLQDVPGLKTEFAPMGGHTGVFSQGISYTGDTMLGATAPANIAIAEMMGAILQNGALSNPEGIDAMWVPGEGSMITADYINDQNNYNEDKSNAVRAMMQQLATDFLSSNPKNISDSRPRLRVTSYGIGANDMDKMAITFTPSQNYLKSLIGSENLPGVYQAAFGPNMEQASFTLIIPRDQMATMVDAQGKSKPVTITNRHTSTREERIFNLTNKYNIDYGRLGGSAKFYKQGGYLYQDIEIPYYNEIENKWDKLQTRTLLSDASSLSQNIAQTKQRLMEQYMINVGIVNQNRQ